MSLTFIGKTIIALLQRPTVQKQFWSCSLMMSWTKFNNAEGILELNTDTAKSHRECHSQLPLPLPRPVDSPTPQEPKISSSSFTWCPIQLPPPPSGKDFYYIYSPQGSLSKVLLIAVKITPPPPLLVNGRPSPYSHEKARLQFLLFTLASAWEGLKVVCLFCCLF